MGQDVKGCRQKENLITFLSPSLSNKTVHIAFPVTVGKVLGSCVITNAPKGSVKNPLYWNKRWQYT